MYRVVILYLIFVINNRGFSQSNHIDSLKNEFDSKNGLYFEREIPNNFNPSVYTSDNKIYTLNKTFFYNYYFIEHKDTLKLTAKVEEIKVGDFIEQRLKCGFVPSSYQKDDLLTTIAISIVDGFNDTQSIIEYKYYNQNNIELNYYSNSGLVENGINIWIHPFRDGNFSILQYNPFPFVQFPLEIGNEWTWELLVGNRRNDIQLEKFDRNVKNSYTYEINDKKQIRTKMGLIDCWVINSDCNSELGHTELIAYFNEEYGFVKLDYLNIDKSRLVIELKEIK